MPTCLLEVQQSEGLELDGSFGFLIPARDPGEGFQVPELVCDARPAAWRCEDGKNDPWPIKISPVYRASLVPFL